MEKPKIKGKTKIVLEKTKQGKSSSSKALEKAKVKAKSFGKASKAMKALKNAKLTRANLEKRGSLILEGKMKMATEEAEDEEQAAVLLKKANDQAREQQSLVQAPNCFESWV